MTVKNPLYTHAITNATVVTTAETVVATLNGVNPSPNTIVGLLGWLAMTVGTAGTAVRIRIRRDSLTGTVVADTGAVTAGIAAAAVAALDVNGDDSPGDVASQTYVMTVQQTAATGNATINAVALGAYPQ